MGRRWTANEDARLTFGWAAGVDAVARALGRTAPAVAYRAWLLGLGPPSRGTRTVADVARTSGYCANTIMLVAEVIGVHLYRKPRMNARQPRRTAHYAVSEDQEQAIVAYLTARRDGARVMGVRGARTAAGVWGIGRKPAACVGCGTTGRPHRARGECTRCYKRRFRHPPEA